MNPNGSGSKAFPATFAQGPAPTQRKKKDIAEKGMDEEVHGFANSMVEPIAWPRKQVPYPENGSGPKAFPPTANTYAQGPVPQQRKKKDIAEKGMDEEVHGFANSMVEPIAWPRKQVPYPENGTGPKAFPPALSQKSDIANKEVRPDVYTTVHSMVNPTAHWRSNKAPKSNYEAWWGDAGPPKAELPTPACSTEEIDSEPDMAALKAAKFMADEKAKDDKKAKAEDVKQEAAITKAEEEEAKEKADKAPKDDKKEEGDEKKEEGAEEPKKEGAEEPKKEGAEEPKKDEPKKEDAAPKDDKKTATAKTDAAPAPAKIVKLMTGDLIYDKSNNLWRHEPVFLQTQEE